MYLSGTTLSSFLELHRRAARDQHQDSDSAGARWRRRRRRCHQRLTAGVLFRWGRSRPARDARARQLHAQERVSLHRKPVPDICENITRSNHSLIRLPNTSLANHVLGLSVGCFPFQPQTRLSTPRRVAAPFDAFLGQRRCHG